MDKSLHYAIKKPDASGKSVNTLEVHAVQSHFDFFVNGTKVGQADDSSPDIGGPAALTGSAGIEVVFSDLKITSAF